MIQQAAAVFTRLVDPLLQVLADGRRIDEKPRFEKQLVGNPEVKASSVGADQYRGTVGFTSLICRRNPDWGSLRAF